jgi:uncharacterized protein
MSVPLPCPFFAGGMLTDSKFFVGREQEIGSVISCMTGDQPRSVNIVGRQNIGRSSLLWHICHTYETRVLTYERQPQEFVVVYLSLKEIEEWGASRFYQEMARCLWQQVRDRQVLGEPLLQKNMGYSGFRSALVKWKQQGVLPVICLDDFDTMLKHRQKFDNDFYDNLRSIVDGGLLMLIIASRKPLRQQKREYRYTSGFFNLFQLDQLREFSPGEAAMVLNFPIGQSAKPSLAPLPKSLKERIVSKFAGKKPPEPARSLSSVAVLNADQQKVASQWAGNQPYLLQLAGKCLFEAKQIGQSEAWAKQRFDDNSSGVPRERDWGRMTANGFSWVGGCTQYIGGLPGNWGKAITGIVTIGLIAGVTTGKIQPQQLFDWGKKMVNDAFDKGKTPEVPKAKDLTGGKP